MARQGLGAGIAALALLSACSEETPAAGNNIVEANDTVVVPGDSAPVANAVDAAAPADAHATPILNLAPDGLALVDAESGATRALNFGIDSATAVAGVTAALGNPMGQSTNTECGAGPLDHIEFQGGLTLFAQDGKFVGWDVDGDSGYSTANGIKLGMPLSALRASGTEVEVQESSLGTEFSAGDMGGVLDGEGAEAKIANLWAGATCIAR